MTRPCIGQRQRGSTTGHSPGRAPAVPLPLRGGGSRTVCVLSSPHERLTKPSLRPSLGDQAVQVTPGTHFFAEPG